LKKLLRNKPSEKYVYKQKEFVCKIYLHFNYKQSHINIHYISLTQNCYAVQAIVHLFLHFLNYLVKKRLSERVMFRPTLSLPTSKVSLAHGKRNRMIPQFFHIKLCKYSNQKGRSVTYNTLYK